MTSDGSSSEPSASPPPLSLPQTPSANGNPTGLLAGKVACITGGLTGIGRAIALEFLSQGAHVVINHLSDQHDGHHIPTLHDERSANGTHCITVAGDISDPATGRLLVQTAITHFHRLDIFVSNAGVCEFADFLSITPDLYSKTVRTNLDGAFYAVQAAARQMAEQNPPGGSIIALSSISALVGGAQQTHYTPTKAGVLSLMQSCATALGKYGIRCNALLPGTIETQLNEEDLRDEGKRGYMEGRTPLGRVGVPRDLAGPAVFLASEYLSGFVTGAQVLVDGGLFVNLQ
ncbi:MAG: L-rhamnose-1-dehydrogenase [Cirrosporium novae-zelandiae]|nr:MAG: L-rhamnose-1-dehydrogenase [Cirrosporium novae-zelandiae]